MSPPTFLRGGATDAAPAYFRDRAAEGGALGALREARASGRRVVGLFCTFIPEELVLAVGAVPVRLCGGAPPTGGGELPRDTCPVVRAAVEAVQRGPLAALLDAAVVPTTCDWKVQAASRLAPRRLLRVELPRGGRPEALATEFARLAEDLAEVTDFALTRESLRRALDLTARARAAQRRIEALRRRPVPPISGCEAMRVADAYGYGDLAGWTEACEALAGSLETTAADGPSGPRIVFHGSPMIWPNFRVAELVEQCGGLVVGDDFCSRASRLAAPEVPPGSVREMLAGLAQRSLEPCTCGVAAQPSSRREALLRLTRQLDADGVVCHYLRGCAPAAAGQPGILSALRAGGVPVLALETEAGREDVEGLRTRIEAFVELLTRTERRGGT